MVPLQKVNMESKKEGITHSFNATENTDKIKRIVEKISKDDGLSPMSPPDYTNPPSKINEVPFDKLPSSIQKLINEHKEVLQYLNDFETSMQGFHNSNYNYSAELSKQLSKFFEFIDKHLFPHHQKEEKILFPVLEKYLVKSGEHSKYMTNGSYETSVDLMEDDHLKFIQVTSIVFNLLGVFVRIPDATSRHIIADLIYYKSMEMIELLRTHIYQEEHIIFPQCVKYFSDEEFQQINTKIK